MTIADFFLKDIAEKYKNNEVAEADLKQVRKAMMTSEDWAGKLDVEHVQNIVGKVGLREIEKVTGETPEVFTN